MTHNLALDAWTIARDITRSSGDDRKTLEATFKMASALSGALATGDFSGCVDCLGGLAEEIEQVVPVAGNADTAIIATRDAFALCDGDTGRQCPDKSLTSVRNNEHDGSSFDRGDGSAAEGETPPRNETVARVIETDGQPRVGAMSDLRSARTAMQQAEHLIREAEALATPAQRTESLLQSYRLARPDVQAAFVMGLVARVACAGMPSRPEASR